MNIYWDSLKISIHFQKFPFIKTVFVQQKWPEGVGVALT